MRRKLDEFGHITKLDFVINKKFPDIVYFPYLKEIGFYKGSRILDKDFFESHAKTLKKIVIAYCNISEIPELGRLPQLEQLNISRNEIVSLNTLDKLKDCGNLRELNLSNNKVDNFLY